MNCIAFEKQQTAADEKKMERNQTCRKFHRLHALSIFQRQSVFIQKKKDRKTNPVFIIKNAIQASYRNTCKESSPAESGSFPFFRYCPSRTRVIREILGRLLRVAVVTPI